MDFKKEIAALKKEVDAELIVYLDRVIKQTREEDKTIAGMLEYFKKILLAGGKRIRPIMMVYGYLAAGGTNRKEIIKTAVSIELAHAFLLMHDDIVDRDDLRHGKKTMHAHYRDYARVHFNATDSEHFGMATALIMGDLAYALANDVLFSAQFDAERVVVAMKKLQEVVGRTAIGEVQDVIMEYKGHATEQEILAMYINKTARYTFEGPLHLGAMLVADNEKLCKQLSAFAVPLGIAFQLRDDYLGIFGSSKKTGKPVGSDIAEGKMTLLVARALQKADRSQRKSIQNLLGDSSITKRDVITFQKLMTDTGAKGEIDKEIEHYVTTAQEAVAAIELAPNVEAFLMSLAEYIHVRDK